MPSPSPEQGILTHRDLIAETANEVLVDTSKVETATREVGPKQQNLLNELGTLHEAQSGYQKIIKGAELAEQKRTQTGMAQIAERVGIKPGDPNDAVLEQIFRVRTAEERVRDAQAEIKRGRESAFADNPIQFIIDGISRGLKERDVKDAAELLSFEQGRLGNLNVQLDESKKIYKTTGPVMDKTVEFAATEAAGFEALAKAKEIQGKAAGIPLVNAKAILEMSKERMDAVYKATQAKNWEADYALRVESMAALRDERALQHAEKAARLALAKEQKDIDDDFMAKLKRGHLIRTGQEITEGEVKTKLALFKNKGPGAEEVFTDYQIGSRQWGSLGDTPADVVAMQSKMPVYVPPTEQKIQAILNRARDSVPTELQDPKNPARARAHINRAVVSEVNGQFNRIVPDPSNMFFVGDLSTFIPNSPALIHLPLVSQVLNDAIAAKQPLSDPRDMLEKLIGPAIISGKITAEQAASGMSAIYKQAHLFNLTTLQPDKYAIPLPGNGLRYNAIMDYTGNTVNLTNEGEVKRTISKWLATKIYKMPFLSEQIGDPKAALRRIEAAKLFQKGKEEEAIKTLSAPKDQGDW